MLKATEVEVGRKSCGNEIVVFTSTPPVYAALAMLRPYELDSDIVCVLPRVVHATVESVFDAVTT